jgi:hypothetical protein
LTTLNESWCCSLCGAVRQVQTSLDKNGAVQLNLQYLQNQPYWTKCQGFDFGLFQPIGGHNFEFTRQPQDSAFTGLKQPLLNIVILSLLFRENRFI